MRLAASAALLSGQTLHAPQTAPAFSCARPAQGAHESEASCRSLRCPGRFSDCAGFRPTLHLQPSGGRFPFAHSLSRSSPGCVMPSSRGNCAPVPVLSKCGLPSKCRRAVVRFGTRLAVLEREGLVVKVPHRGACVLEFDPRLLREAASLRGRLEEFAVSLVVPRLGADDLARLESLVQGMEDAARRHAVQEFSDLDYRFHDAIFQMSRPPHPA